MMNDDWRCARRGIQVGSFASEEGVGIGELRIAYVDIDGRKVGSRVVHGVVEVMSKN